MKKLTAQEINGATLFVQLLWFLLLVPWIWLCPASGMAFDSGDSLHARFVVLSVCTYPVAVFIAALLRKGKPWLVLLPFVNLLGFLISGSYR